MKVINIKIEETLWKQIKIIGKSNERSISGEIRFQLHEIYDTHDTPKQETPPKNTNLPFSSLID